MLDESTLGVRLFTGILLVIVSLCIISYKGVDPLLDAIPTVGFSDPILSCLSAFRFTIMDGTPMLIEGYQKTKPGIFKIPFFKRWAVIPSSPELIEDVRKAPDDILSIDEPLRELIQTDYTLRFLDMNSIYHRGVIRSKLARDIAATFDQVQDELPGALRDCIPDVGDGVCHDSILHQEKPPALASDNLVLASDNFALASDKIFFARLSSLTLSCII